jgi:hypothetical protein
MSQNGPLKLAAADAASQPTSSRTAAPADARAAAPADARAAAPADADPSAATTAPAGTWGWLAIGLLPVLAAYALLFNPQWVPGGDSEVYLSIARNLLKGRGYLYNGEPVAMIPPGWPVALAGLLWISPTFAFIKLAMAACMVGSLAIAYFVLLRFLHPRAAAGAIALAGVLYPVYPLTFWTHSEALFCLLAWGTLLMAFRVAEGKDGVAGIAALLLLAAGASFVRWTGLIQLVLIVAILLSGGRWRLSQGLRAWGLAALVSVVIVGMFVGTYQALKLTPEEMSRARAVGGAMDREDAGAEPINAEASSIRVVDTQAVGKRSLAEEYVHRFANAGQWFGWFFWYPLRFGQSVRVVGYLALLVGWLTILLLAVTMLVQAKRGQWLWVALALYTGALCMNWPNPNARYFVPVAPLLVAGVWFALRWLHEHAAARRPRLLARAGKTAFVASVLACNLSLLAIDVRVMRSDRFYDEYEAGAHASLIDACQVLMATQNPPRDGQIAVSERYTNLGRNRFSKAGLRSVVALTDLIVRPVPARHSKPPTGALANWATRGLIVRTPYFLYQEPTSPWRVWHFRLSPEQQERLTGVPAEAASGGWRLYKLRGPFDRRWKRLEVRPIPDPITRVPGL